MSASTRALADLARAGYRVLHEPSMQTFEGVISIEDEPKRMLLRHGLVIADTAAYIAETALHAGDAALLSMQCPAQLPPTNSFWDGGGVDGRVVEPARSSSLAIRFAMALERPSADLRLQVADRLARHCEDRGLGLWLADTRPGYRSGNWFLVLPHDRATARDAAYRRSDGQRRAGNAADGCLPLTMVGPARQGSVHAILSFLGQFPTIGVLACSMSVLGELAFLHLQLGVPSASRARLAAVNAGIRDRKGDRGPVEQLGQVLTGLLEDPSADRCTPEVAERLLDRAGDYQTVMGPALPVIADARVRRVPIWLSWRMRRSESGLRTPLLALHRALGQLGLLAPEGGGPNIEYLVCRQLSGAMLGGKGKLAIPSSLLNRRAGNNRRGTADLAVDLELAWKSELRTCGEEHRFTGVSASTREFLLGDGHPLG